MWDCYLLQRRSFYLKLSGGWEIVKLQSVWCAQFSSWSSMTPKNPTQDFTKEAIHNRYSNLMTSIELSNSGLQIKKKKKYCCLDLFSRVFFPPLSSEKEKIIYQNNPNKWPAQTTILPQYERPYFCFGMIWLINSNSHILGCSRGVSWLTNERCWQTKGLSCISVH